MAMNAARKWSPPRSFRWHQRESSTLACPALLLLLASVLGASALSAADGQDGAAAASSADPPPPAAALSVPLHRVDGSHHVRMYVGSPRPPAAAAAARVALIVDTGSRLVAFPCGRGRGRGRGLAGGRGRGRGGREEGRGAGQGRRLGEDQSFPRARTAPGYDPDRSSTARAGSCRAAPVVAPPGVGGRAQAGRVRGAGNGARRAMGDGGAGRHGWDQRRRRNVAGAAAVAGGGEGCHFSGLSTCRRPGIGTAAAAAGGGEEPAPRCEFTQRYTEGSSLTAYEMSDVVWLGTDHPGESASPAAAPAAPWSYLDLAVPLTFGCQTSESGLFVEQYADGILGVALHQRNETLIGALYGHGAIDDYAFSLCLSGDGGVMGLGGTHLGLREGDDHDKDVVDIDNDNDIDNDIDAKGARAGQRARHLAPMRFTPLSKDHGWYAVQVVEVRVGPTLVTAGNVLASFNDGKGTIIDSGTTDTFLPKGAAKAIRRAWKALSGRPYSNTLERYTHQQFQRLPDVTLTLAGNVTWVLSPHNFMEAAKLVMGRGGGTNQVEEIVQVDTSIPWTGVKTFTNRLYLDEVGGCVLGGNAMAGHDILFDVGRRRVGIAEADCSYAPKEYVVD